MKCLTALHLVQKEKRNKRKDSKKENYEFVKSKIFNAAISMIIGDKFDSNEGIVGTIISGLLDERKMFDKQSWLPQHFAIALAVRNKISEDDLRVIFSVDPLASRSPTNEADYERADEKKWFL
jgi:hypothetical protein